VRFFWTGLKVKATLFVAALIGNSLIGSALAQTAVDTPSNLQLVGQIAPSATVTSVPLGSTVLAINKAKGTTEGSGSTADANGTFLISMSKTSSFNGTELLIRVKISGVTYEVLSGGSPASVIYSGGFPFPATAQISGTVGDVVSGGGGGGGGGDGDGDGDGGGDEDCSNGNDRLDVNGDGVFNQADIDAIKEAFISGENTEAADVDGNGLVTSADAIIAIKAMVRAQHGQAGRCAPPSTEDTSGTGTTGNGSTAGTGNGSTSNASTTP
jgi:hypothetical protein